MYKFIYGNEGDDALSGGEGDDVIKGRRGNDLIYGKGGNDILRGSEGNDVLFGEAGNDVLIGGLGADILVGGYGGDVFVFHTALAGEVEVIVDFEAGTDTVRLDGRIFTGINTNGVLAAGAFRAGMAAADADDRAIGRDVLVG